MAEQQDREPARGMLRPMAVLFKPVNPSILRTILTWGGSILLGLVAIELTIGGPVAALGWVIETLGPGGLAGVICLGFVGMIVVWNL